MLDEVIELIEKEEYSAAEAALQEYVHSDDARIQASAYYLIGYINTCWNNKNKNDDKARRFLLYNLNSEHPNRNAYTLYARLEEDKNIVEKYLNQGLLKFPNHPQLLYALLVNSHDKTSVIARILGSDSTDFALLSKVIEVLIAEHKWGKISRLIFRIQSNNTLDEEQATYLNLLSGFASIFGERVDYSKAIELFESVEKWDLNNQLGYAHYLGLIYSHIKNNSLDKAIDYFDKLPVNNSIFDLFEGPWHFISVDFHEEYKEIFDLLELEFENDLTRRKKARCLISLYLYNPSAKFGIYRYEESDISKLKDYLDESYNKYVATALIHMYCRFQKYIEANSVFLLTVKNGDDVERFDCYYSGIVENSTEEMLQIIVGKTIEFMENSDSFDRELFRKNALDSLIEQLQEHRLYTDITKIGECFSIDELCSCDTAFYFAYSYNEIHSSKGLVLYKKILEKEPDNSHALNNVGVILERKGDYTEALVYFEKAVALSNEELHINNARRVQEKIEEHKKKVRLQKQKEYRDIAKNVKLDFFEHIGYDEVLISKFSSIQDADIRNILLRDLKECVIAIATGQTKNATIMAGSLIEALLYTKLTEKSITSYVVPTRSGTTNKALKDMALADLLFVAEQEKLITSNSVHLSHYVRDYRNFIHPAKELRSTDNISQENVLIMWSILKRLINELL